MESRPKISVIVPIYNSEKYLKKCIDSIINQTLKEIEIICINDGSTDNSLSILNEYKEKDSRIIVLTQENQGQGVARNNGIEIARGEYLACIDSDDWIESEMFEKLYNTAKEKDAEIVHCNYYTVHKEDLIHHSSVRYLKTKNIKITPGVVYNFKKMPEHVFFGITNFPCLRICKLDFIKKNHIKFTPFKFYEDSPYCLESIILAERIVYLDENLYYYRDLETSCSKTAERHIVEIYDNFNDIISKYFKNNKKVQKSFDTYWAFVFISDYLHFLKNKTEKFKALLKYQKYFTLNQRLIIFYRMFKNLILKIKKR